MLSAMKKVATRVVSAFVVTFLCFNAGAFFCLAHCNKVSAATNYCPLKHGSSHCHGSQTSKPANEEAVSGSNITCTMLPVGVFSAPLEKRSDTLTPVAVVTVVEQVEFAPVVFAESRQLPKFYYRPPPNDVRPDRVRNQVFRI
jgi:hypothetical protein